MDLRIRPPLVALLIPGVTGAFLSWSLIFLDGWLALSGTSSSSSEFSRFFDSISLLVGFVWRPAFVVAELGAGVSGAAGVGGNEDRILIFFAVEGVGVPADAGALGSLKEFCLEPTLSFSLGLGGGGLISDMAAVERSNAARTPRMKSYCSKQS